MVRVSYTRNEKKTYNDIQETLSNIADGATLVPIILGSDKTVVSVATGHMEFGCFMAPPAVFTTMFAEHMAMRSSL